MQKRPNHCKGYYRALFLRKVAFRQIPRQFSPISLTLSREFKVIQLIRVLSLICQPISPESGHSERTLIALLQG